MHELSITQHILDHCLHEAEKQKVRKITVIRLCMGPFSGLVPECIQMYLDLLAEGTPAEGAKVEARILPLKIRCRDCGHEGEITRRRIACPVCQSLRLQVLSGREFFIESMEVEEDGNQSTSSDNGVE